MSESPKSKAPIAVQLTNWIFRKGAQGIASGAKAGYEKVREIRDEKFEKNAVEAIHDIMYAGVKHLPGHPRPAIRTTALSTEEVQAFTKAAEGLTQRGVKLPGYVTNFAANFNIKIKG